MRCRFEAWLRRLRGFDSSLPHQRAILSRPCCVSGATHKEVNKVDKREQDLHEMMAELTAKIDSYPEEKQRELRLYLSGYLAGMEQTTDKKG